MLLNLSKTQKIFIAAVAATALIAGFVGVVAGLTYPDWSSKLSFLPSYLNLRQTKTVQQGEEKVIRTVEESSVIDVVDKASPAVVSIVAESASIQPGKTAADNQQGIGTGFIVNSNGIILTNSHVVFDDSVTYKIATKDKKTFNVKKIDRDSSTDLAILKVEAKNLPVVNFADSDSVKVGQKVVAIGNALGRFNNTVTVGVISGIGRGVTASDSQGLSQETLENVIQTDAALNPGNSGGPLLDLSGNVVGINFATTVGAENLGFVIPINRIKPILDQYLALGRIVKPYIGISYTTVDQTTSLLENIPQGAFVRAVVSGTPAAKAGLKQGDIVTKINSTALSDGNTLAGVIGKFKVGQSVDLEVWRDSKTIKLKAVLAESP